MKHKKTKVIIAGLVIGVSLGASASSCDKAAEPFKDAKRTGTTNNEPADVVTMPDGFSNMATKCDHGNRVYSAFHGDAKYGAIFVVPNDPSCQ
jgi:hypothetical protein